MIANDGFEKTKEWISGIVNNMARKPSGDDTDQIYAVGAGEGDVEVCPITEDGKGIAISDGRSSGAFAAASAVGIFSSANANNQ
ncbi:Iron uptake protein [Dirofilaria immitis]